MITMCEELEIPITDVAICNNINNKNSLYHTAE